MDVPAVTHQMQERAVSDSIRGAAVIPCNCPDEFATLKWNGTGERKASHLTQAQDSHYAASLQRHKLSMCRSQMEFTHSACAVPPRRPGSRARLADMRCDGII